METLLNELCAAIVNVDDAKAVAAVAANPEVARFVFPADDRLGPLNGATLMHLAAQYGTRPVAKALFEAGADLDVRNAEGRTALHDAFEHGQCLADDLIAWGAQVDVCAAAAFGMPEKLEALLSEDPRRANDLTTGLSPAGWASFGGQLESLRILHRHGARLDDGELLCAAQVNRVPVGEVLLALGVDVNQAFPPRGDTALHMAARLRVVPDTTAFVSFLLDQGANPTIRNLEGLTALDIAEQGMKQGDSKASSAVAELLR